ncbi:MAG: class I adenylate-forming enzyme family protein [Desulforhopalus sp.]
MDKNHPYEWLRQNSMRYGENIALEDINNTLTYTEMKTQTDSVVASLHNIGVRHHDLVAYVSPKNHNEAVLFLAILAMGAIAVPINRLWKPYQMAKSLFHCGVSWLIADKNVIKAVQAEPLTKKFTFRLIDIEFLKREHREIQPDVITDITSDTPSLILFTSGSTGHPKGVVHTCDTLGSWTDSTIEYLGNNHEDRIIGHLSLSFGYGLNQFLSALKVGARFRVASSILTLDALREAVEWGATGLAGVPQFWKEAFELLRRGTVNGNDLKLRYITNAGGHLSRDIQLRLKDQIGETDLISMYGMTETLRSSYVPSKLFEKKAGSLGIPVPGAELTLVDEENNQCSIGQLGEIVHSGPTVFLGYWGTSYNTEKKLRSESALSRRNCHTGDIAWQDDDGIFWFQSRKDRQLKVRGFRFGPHEVEDEVRMIPSVRDAALVSIKNIRNESILHLFVVQEHTEEGQLLDQIHQHLRIRVASYMMPNQIHVWTEDFPRTGNGKLDIKALITDVTNPQNSIILSIKKGNFYGKERNNSISQGI